MNYKNEIKDTGLKLNKLAEMFGISKTLMSFYINGVRPMPEHIETRLKKIINNYKKILN